MSDPLPKPIAITVVIPAYNQADLLPRLFNSIDAQVNAEEVELIVVDDCSPDHTERVCREWMAQPRRVRARYIRHEKNGGPGMARNTGAEAAQGPIVAFTDSDCVAHPEWLVHLVKPLDPANNIVGVGGRVRPYSEDRIVARYHGMNGTLEPLRSDQFHIPFLVTCNCCYVRSELLAVGGFMGDIRSPGGEDVAASIRLRKQGRLFEFTDDALIFHDFRDDLRAFVRTWFSYGYGCSLVANRLLHPTEIVPEACDFSQEHYWGIWPIRPTVTGLRSFFKDFGIFWWLGRHNEYSRLQVLEAMLLRPFDRISYYRGWRAGMRAYEQESGQRSAMRARGHSGQPLVY